MNVLLISTNRERTPQTLIPLGVCCVASAARSVGHEVDVLDLCFERNPVAAVERVVGWLQPDIIGISIRNLDNCDYTQPHSYLPEVKKIVQACRRKSGSPIVLGGPAVSQAPAAIARELDCRLAISGEGEVAFLMLLDALENKGNIGIVPGITIVGGSEARSVPIRKIQALKKLPDPDISRWIDLRMYRQFDTAFPIQTKRGCAFHCNYCVYPQLEGTEWRLREPEWVAGEVVSADTQRLRMVEFVDSVFGFPEEHAVACCEEISRRGTHISLSTMDLNPAACTPALIEAMNAARFSAVGITAESGSDTMLQRLGKSYSVADLRRAAGHLHGLRARKLWMFMVGGPGETPKTVRETARFIESLGEDSLVLVTHGVRVLPGTGLQAELVEQGMIQADDPLIAPVFYYSSEIDRESAERILADCRFPAANMVTLHDGGHKLIPLVQRMFSLLGLRPPYWRYLPRINRARKVMRL